MNLPKKQHSIEMHINSERGGENASIKSLISPHSDTDNHPKMIEVCPGVAVETIKGHISCVRLYPVPENADELSYQPLESEASADIAEMTETLETLVRKLKSAA